MGTASRSLLRRADEAGWPLLVMRLALGCIFVTMGVAKIGDPVAFLKSVRIYDMLPETPPYYLNATAVILPWLEVFCGTALILGVWIRGASACLAIMLVVFTPAIFLRAMLVHAEDGTPFFQIAFDCGCGGGPVIIWKKLLENLGLLTLAVLALMARSRSFTLTAVLNRCFAPRTGEHAREATAPPETTGSAH